MRRWSWRLGRLFGIDIYLHLSLLLLAAVIWLSGGGLVGVLALTLTFASVVAHELGHSLTARAYGIPTREIELYPFGGLAKLSRMPSRPKDEMVIAAAGPAVSLALAVTFFGLWSVVPTSGLVQHLAVINLLLGLFNLLPAFPMDGGRVFRAWLALRKGEPAATQLAVKVSRGVAVAMGVLGLFTQPWLIVLAAVVWFLASAEGARVRLMGSDFAGQRSDRWVEDHGGRGAVWIRWQGPDGRVGVGRVERASAPPPPTVQGISSSRSVVPDIAILPDGRIVHLTS